VYFVVFIAYSVLTVRETIRETINDDGKEIKQTQLFLYGDIHRFTGLGLVLWCIQQFTVHVGFTVTSLAQPCHSYSPYAISSSVVETACVNFSAARSTSIYMARTKQTPRKPRSVKDGDKDKASTDFTCFICGHKFDWPFNFRRHLARTHSKKPDGTHADEEYREQFANKRSMKYVQGLGTKLSCDFGTCDVEPMTPPAVQAKFIRRSKKETKAAVPLATDTHETGSPKKIVASNNETVLAEADTIEVLDDGMDVLFNEAAMAIANIPDLALGVSGMDIPFADMDANVFAFLGEVDHQQTEFAIQCLKRFEQVCCSNLVQLSTLLTKSVHAGV